MRNIEVQDIKEQEERVEGTPIHGDLLEEVFARVPLIDLACASRVSKSWEFAVTSSLFYINKLKPWLIIQTQNTSLSKKIKTHAYDPRSNTWIELSRVSNPTKHIKLLQSSGSSLLYELSSEELSFSMDPLHHTWHHIPPPRVWRVDPIVTLIGPYVIVAGGGSSYWDDDPLTVEMYDMDTSQWYTCQSMPDILKDSAASTWLSVTSNQHKMYVTEKASGITYSFSPQAKTWSGPYNLRPEPSIYFSAILFAGDDLILAGLIGHADSIKTLKLWKIDPELMENVEIGEIPVEFLEKLQGENSCYFLSSITILGTKDFIYMYKTSDPAEIILCEFIEGKCKWGSVKNLVLDDDCKLGSKMVMSCGRVGISDLHMAVNYRNLRFIVKSNVQKSTTSIMK